METHFQMMDVLQPARMKLALYAMELFQMCAHQFVEMEK